MGIVINNINKMLSNIEMIDFTFTTIETSKRKKKTLQIKKEEPKIIIYCNKLFLK